MTRAEAASIVAKLAAAYPQTNIEEESVDLFIREIALLAEFAVGDEAADQIIRGEEFFPKIAVFRSYYRSVNEARHRGKPKQDERPVDTTIPEWVHVWWWALRVKDEKREFPQCHDMTLDELETAWHESKWEEKAVLHPRFGHIDPSVISQTVQRERLSYDEYKQLREEWVEAGSPSTIQVSELLADATRAAS